MTRATIAKVLKARIVLEDGHWERFTAAASTRRACSSTAQFSRNRARWHSRRLPDAAARNRPQGLTGRTAISAPVQPFGGELIVAGKESTDPGAVPCECRVTSVCSSWQAAPDVDRLLVGAFVRQAWDADGWVQQNSTPMPSPWSNVRPGTENSFVTSTNPNLECRSIEA